MFFFSCVKYIHRAQVPTENNVNKCLFVRLCVNTLLNHASNRDVVSKKKVKERGKKVRYILYHTFTQHTLHLFIYITQNTHTHIYIHIHEKQMISSLYIVRSFDRSFICLPFLCHAQFKQDCYISPFFLIICL